jgi:hypothetical protein
LPRTYAASLYSLLCPEICDIGETGIFNLLEAIGNFFRHLLGLWTVLLEYWRGLLVLYFAGLAIGSFLYGPTFFVSIFDTRCALLGMRVAYVIIHTYRICPHWIFVTLGVNEQEVARLYMQYMEAGIFLCSFIFFWSIFEILRVLLGVRCERVDYVVCYISAIFLSLVCLHQLFGIFISIGEENISVYQGE